MPAAELRRELLRWYDGARRALPWRAAPGAVAAPWPVLVSEVMLQQTTAATVRARFPAFLAAFPTPSAMAVASLDDVLRAWQGLGYYRRARALHACAEVLVRDHGGEVPRDVQALRALPGVGTYTAAAVAAIAFDVSVVAVDGNVERVLARLVALERPLPSARPVIEAVAVELARGQPGGSGRGGDVAQALMELGALVCTPRRPACLACPWRSWCRAAATGAPERLPLRLKPGPRPTRHAAAYLLQRPDGAILFRRRPPEGLLGGMIELPGTAWGEREPAPEAVAAAAPAAASWRAVAGRVRHVFSHFALEVELWRGRCELGPDGLWCPPERLGELALPTLTKRLLRHAAIAA